MAKKLIIWTLRLLGINSLLALVFLVFPDSWIAATHLWLGLGEFPDSPIVGYLSRSLCLFYAVLGTLLIGLSCNVDQHWNLVKLFAKICPLIGGILLVIDIAQKLPLWWILLEGPFMIILGGLFLYLVRKCERQHH